MKGYRFIIGLAVTSLVFLSSCQITVGSSSLESSMNESTLSILSVDESSHPIEVSSSIDSSSAVEASTEETISVELSSLSDVLSSEDGYGSESECDQASSSFEESSFCDESSEEESSVEEEASEIVSDYQTNTSGSELDDYEVIETPKKRMPAEFEPASMVKMCYPNNMPLSVYKTIAEDNRVLVLVNPSSKGLSRIPSAKTDFQNAGVNMDNVTFFDMPIDYDNNYWVRDFSPFYVFDDMDLSIVDFTYNRPARVEQNAVPKKLSEYFDFDYAKMDIVQTGGNLMQDGRGRAFSDDLVIAENDDDKDKVLSQMNRYTGTEDYVITIDPQGDYIAHIDCWGKIVAPDKIIVARLPKENPRYQYYEKVAEELGNLKCCYGYNYRIYRIDEPGEPTIAPYTNSLIANGHVYMPLGEDPSYNAKAIEVYQQALPSYEIVGVEGYGFENSECFLNTDALHCRTHEVPDNDMLFIDARDVYRGEVEYQDEYLVKANIVSYANETLDQENVKVFYSINGSEYREESMVRYADTSNFTYSFSGLTSGDEVSYYIEAKDESNRIAMDPTCGRADPHCFRIA